MNNYSTKRTSNNSFESYSKHRRDYSPSRRSHSRNSSPDSLSPRGPSSYSSKPYSRKSKDHDSKYYDGGSKSKYIRLSRSPVGHESSRSSFKNHSSGHSRDSYYENNHSSYSSSKRTHFGDWTAVVSSSGKSYYYNGKTEVSQWNKPKEWAEWEMRHASKYSISSSSSEKYSNSSYRDKYDHNSSSQRSYNHSNESYSSRERHKDSYSSRHGSPSYRSHNSKTRESEKRTTNDLKKSRDLSNDYSYSNKKSESSVPKNSSDSQCNILKNNNNHNAKSEHHHESSRSSVNNSTNNNNNNSSNSKNKVAHINTKSSNLQLDPTTVSSTIMTTLASLVSSGQPSLNITNLLTQFTNSHGVNVSNSLSEDAIDFLKKALDLSNSQPTILLNNLISHIHNSKASVRNSASVSHQKSTSSPTSQPKHHSNSNTNKTHQPTSSYRSAEKHELDHPPKTSFFSPESKNGCRNENVPSSSSLSTISAASSTVSQKSTVPNFQRFKHLYRADLVGHVSGWNSEPLEKEACELSEQVNHIGNFLCTRVSTELKNARSMVRVTEIRTTLQQQRIFFVNQQIKVIEDWKGKNFASS
ncbi:hypothetical protein BLOT_003689, partial [Blomia tropicalis]